MEKNFGWLLKEKYQGNPTKNFYKDVKRLKAGEPVDYVIGFTEFLDCKIDLSKKPLISRPETEFWVEKAIEEIKNRKPFGTAQGKILRILDMFAGSGCIGLAVLKHIKNTEVIFVDIDKNNLEQIKINCKLNGIDKKRCKFIQSNIFKGLNPSSRRLIRAKYDFVFANPPYIPDYEILRNRIQKSVLRYESKKALFGGKDGLFYIKKFLKGAKKQLNSGGKIFMEFDSPQKNKIETLLKKYRYKDWQFNQDQYGKWRWVAVVVQNF